MDKKTFFIILLIVSVVGIVLYLVSPKFKKAVDDAFKVVKKAGKKGVDASCKFVKSQADAYAKSREQKEEETA